MSRAFLEMHAQRQVVSGTWPDVVTLSHQCTAQDCETGLLPP